MYRGKRDELEYNGETGTFYSVWFSAEDDGGSMIEITGYDVLDEMAGDAFDGVDEAAEAIEEAVVEAGVFEDFMADEVRAAWIAAIIEENRLVEGRDMSDAEAWRVREIGYERDGGYYDLTFREGPEVPW